MPLNQGAQRLAAELSRSTRPQGLAHVTVRPATVTAVDTGAASDGADLLTVDYAGAEQETAYLASYTPTVGHVVALVVTSDGATLCLGRIIGTP